MKKEPNFDHFTTVRERRDTRAPHPQNTPKLEIPKRQIPVCAPYTALSPQYYRYRVKLTPGTGKKGKMAHAVSGLFMCECADWTAR